MHVPDTYSSYIRMNNLGFDFKHILGTSIDYPRIAVYPISSSVQFVMQWAPHKLLNLVSLGIIIINWNKPAVWTSTLSYNLVYISIKKLSRNMFSRTIIFLMHIIYCFFSHLAFELRDSLFDLSRNAIFIAFGMTWLQRRRLGKLLKAYRARRWKEKLKEK